jgi:hypothetical protein
MRRSLLVIYVGLLLIFFCLFTGCQENLSFNEKGSNEVLQSVRHSDISNRIGSLKDAGLLDSLLASGSNRNVTASEFNEEQVKYFIEHTDEALADIALLEKGEIQIQLISALLSDSTVGEVADIMALLSEDMAEEYLLKAEEIFSSLAILDDNNVTSRSIAPNNNVRNIRLGFYDNVRNNTASRGAYAADFNTDTIIWYTGFCVATVAGCVAANSLIPWVAIPGVVVAVAGGVSMGVQLIRWYTCTQFSSFVDSFIGKDSKKATELLNSGIGPKLLTVATITTTTAVALYCTYAGRAAWTAVKSAWNAIVTKIISVLPKGINFIIMGIPITPI